MSFFGLALLTMTGCYCAGPSDESSCIPEELSAELLSSTTRFELGNCPDTTWTFELRMLNETSQNETLEIKNASTTLWTPSGQVEGSFDMPLTELTLTLDSAPFDGVVPANQDFIVRGQTLFTQGLVCEGRCKRESEITIQLGNVETTLVSDQEIGEWNHTNCSSTDD